MSCSLGSAYRRVPEQQNRQGPDRTNVMLPIGVGEKSLDVVPADNRQLTASFASVTATGTDSVSDSLRRC